MVFICSTGSSNVNASGFISVAAIISSVLSSSFFSGFLEGILSSASLSICSTSCFDSKSDVCLGIVSGVSPLEAINSTGSVIKESSSAGVSEGTGEDSFVDGSSSVVIGFLMIFLTFLTFCSFLPLILLSSSTFIRPTEVILTSESCSFTGCWGVFSKVWWTNSTFSIFTFSTGLLTVSVFFSFIAGKFDAGFSSTSTLVGFFFTGFRSLIDLISSTGSSIFTSSGFLSSTCITSSWVISSFFTCFAWGLSFSWSFFSSAFTGSGPVFSCGKGVDSFVKSSSSSGWPVSSICCFCIFLILLTFVSWSSSSLCSDFSILLGASGIAGDISLVDGSLSPISLLGIGFFTTFFVFFVFFLFSFSSSAVASPGEVILTLVASSCSGFIGLFSNSWWMRSTVSISAFFIGCFRVSVFFILAVGKGSSTFSSTFTFWGTFFKGFVVSANSAFFTGASSSNCTGFKSFAVFISSCTSVISSVFFEACKGSSDSFLSFLLIFTILFFFFFVLADSSSSSAISGISWRIFVLILILEVISSTGFWGTASNSWWTSSTVSISCFSIGRLTTSVFLNFLAKVVKSSWTTSFCFLDTVFVFLSGSGSSALSPVLSWAFDLSIVSLASFNSGKTSEGFVSSCLLSWYESSPTPSSSTSIFSWPSFLWSFFTSAFLFFCCWTIGSSKFPCISEISACVSSTLMFWNSLAASSSIMSEFFSFPVLIVFFSGVIFFSVVDFEATSNIFDTSVGSEVVSSFRFASSSISPVKVFFFCALCFCTIDFSATPVISFVSDTLIAASSLLLLV